MASYFVVMLNFKESPSVWRDRLKTVFDPLKDWLRFNHEGWIVYTGLSATDIRERLRKEFDAEDPSILIIPTDLSGWSAYAKESARNWIKKKRTPDLEDGE